MHLLSHTSRTEGAWIHGHNMDHQWLSAHNCIRRALSQKAKVVSSVLLREPGVCSYQLCQPHRVRLVNMGAGEKDDARGVGSFLQVSSKLCVLQGLGHMASSVLGGLRLSLYPNLYPSFSFTSHLQRESSCLYPILHLSSLESSAPLPWRPSPVYHL